MSSRRIVPMNNENIQSLRQHSTSVQKSKYKEEVVRRKRGRPQREIQEEREQEDQVSLRNQNRKRPQERPRQRREQKKSRKHNEEEDEDDDDEDSNEDSGKSSSDSDESEESDREKKRKIAKQMKIKQMQVIQSKKLIGEKEAVIGTLNTQINQQSQNLSVLNKENENLREKTDQLKSVVAEKQIVQSQFAAQQERVQNAKNAFKRRESMRIDFQADTLSHAFKKAIGNSISGCLERWSVQFDKHYFLSSLVYQISNTYGSKCEAFFHKNASLINCYLWGIIIFVPFFVMFVLSDVSVSGIDSLFLFSYPSSLGSVFGVSVAIFLAIQVLIAFRKFQIVKKKEVSEDAKEGRGIQSFKIIFSLWNWRICNNILVTKSQYALARHARDYFYFFDRLDEKYDYKNPSIWQILGIKLLTLAILSGTVIVPAFLHFKRILLDLTTISFVSEILHGLVIAVIGEAAAKSIIFLNQYEEVVDLYKINSSKYKKKFISKALPCGISILLAYSTFLNNGTLNLDFFDSEIAFQSSRFKFRAQQTSHCLVGLLIGQFLMNIISQLLPSLLRFFKRREEDESNLFKQIEFNMMESAVPLVTQNMIILTLIPFSPFSIFLGIIIFSLDFIFEWIILAKLRLPQYQGLPKAYLRTHFCTFFNQTLVFVFCVYALFFTKRFQTGAGEINPFNWIGQSLFDKVKDQLRQHEVSRVIYDTLTWFPLIACLMVVYFVQNMDSERIKDFWRKEINNKITDINGIKAYYEARIKRLENRIEQAKGELGGMAAESKSTASKKSDEDHPLFIRNDVIPQGSKTSLHTIDIDNNIRIPSDSTSNRLRISSSSHMRNNQSAGQFLSTSKFAPTTLKNIQQSQQDNSFVSRTRINTKDDYNLL